MLLNVWEKMLLALELPCEMNQYFLLFVLVMVVIFQNMVKIISSNLFKR